MFCSCAGLLYTIVLLLRTWAPSVHTVHTHYTDATLRVQRSVWPLLKCTLTIRASRTFGITHTILYSIYTTAHCALSLSLSVCGTRFTRCARNAAAPQSLCDMRLTPNFAAGASLNVNTPLGLLLCASSLCGGDALYYTILCYPLSLGDVNHPNTQFIVSALSFVYKGCFSLLNLPKTTNHSPC